jgi:hypothetical protein
MANKKITQLTDIETSIETEDLLHVIDDPLGDPINKKLKIGNLFENIPGLLNLAQSPETVDSSGTMSTEKVISLINIGTSDITSTLIDGGAGQLKFIVMTTVVGASATITPTHFINGTSMVFNSVGASVLLLYTSSSWMIISNNGATIT